jgi:squalene-hopene/tetraprenyl-beta-curcumene cyclase
MLVIVFLGASRWAPAQEPKLAAQTEPAKPAPNSPDEPLAPVASMSRAAVFLDQVALSWTRQRKCGTCHTNYPYLAARPLLKQPQAPAMVEVRRFFEDRVAHWDDADKTAKPRWDAEVVATAEALALNDAATSGKLHPLTRKALDRIWTVQKPDGGFDWLKCGWPPLENDDYFGAIIAALAVGNAPEGYAATAAAEPGLKRLRGYFANNPPLNLHHQAMLLWASSRLDGLMSDNTKVETIDRLRTLQRPDGGWNLPSLGDWKRHDGTANDSAADSDGYATGLVIYILRQAGIPAADPALKRGVAWLLSHQRASGRWFTRSPNTDQYHFISHAGTAFAVLALRACDVTSDQTGTRKSIQPPEQSSSLRSRVLPDRQPPQQPGDAGAVIDPASLDQRPDLRDVA